MYYDVWVNLISLVTITMVFNTLMAFWTKWKDTEIVSMLMVNVVTFGVLMSVMLTGKVY